MKNGKQTALGVESIGSRQRKQNILTSPKAHKEMWLIIEQKRRHEGEKFVACLSGMEDGV